MVSVIFNAEIKFLSSPPNLQKGLAKNNRNVYTLLP